MANKGLKKPIPPDLKLKKIRVFRSWICEEEEEEEPLLVGARNAQPDFQIPIVISLPSSWPAANALHSRVGAQMATAVEQGNERS
jgi:hypothetical protein